MRLIFAAIVAAFFFAASLMSSFASAEEFVVPRLTGPVVDEARMLDTSAAQSIEAVLRDLHSKGGPQITVLTVESLAGLPIESATIKVTDAWKLGDAKKDNGVLLMVSKLDRKIRIEVGQGLEGDLTDVESKRIISDQMVPYFRAGRPSDGIVVGVRSILGKTAPEYMKTLGDAPAEPPVKKKKRDGGIPFPLFIFILAVFFFLSRGGRRSGLLGALAGASLGRASRGWGGGGGFGGSGGGWSGGGGGFSGGGASGDW